MVGPACVHGQEGVHVKGRVWDQDRRAPAPGVSVRLEGTSHQSLSGEDGLFEFTAVAPSTYILSTDHLTFGAGTQTLEIPESNEVRFTVWLSASAIELEPIVVEVLTQSERQRRAEGSRIQRVTRAQIKAHSGSLSEVLSARVPGISLDRRYRMDPIPSCLELRRPATLIPGCHPPLVILDGIRLNGSNDFLNTVPLEYVESVTVIPPSAAGVRYGIGSAWGVIRVETRSAAVGVTSQRSALEPLARSYDWGREPAGHPWARAMAGATLGTLGGMAVAWGTSENCSPLNEARGQDCRGNGTLMATLAGLALPAAGGALGANLFGRTEWSRGRVSLTAFAAAVPMLMGYVLAVQGYRVDLTGQRILGGALVVAGVPIVSTLADRAFRTRHDRRSDPR